MRERCAKEVERYLLPSTLNLSRLYNPVGEGIASRIGAIGEKPGPNRGDWGVAGMSVDPPWLAEAIRLFDDIKARQSTTLALKRALCFAAAEGRADAARQRREVTDAMITAAAIEIADKRGTGWTAPDIARVAFEAADKACVGMAEGGEG